MFSTPHLLLGRERIRNDTNSLTRYQQLYHSRYVVRDPYRILLDRWNGTISKTSSFFFDTSVSTLLFFL
jgi:hypothetical protein